MKIHILEEGEGHDSPRPPFLQSHTVESGGQMQGVALDCCWVMDSATPAGGRKGLGSRQGGKVAPPPESQLQGSREPGEAGRVGVSNRRTHHMAPLPFCIVLGQGAPRKLFHWGGGTPYI